MDIAAANPWRLATRLSSLTLAVIVASVLPVRAQAPTAATGTIEGIVSTQSGTIKLAGALVTVRDAADRAVAEQICDGDGRFRIGNLREGRYRVVASLDGFDARDVPAVVTTARTTDLSLDLPIAGIAERVEVIGAQTIVSAGETLAPRQAITSNDVEEMGSRGDAFQAALRLLASVIEVPGGVSIKGGRPNQAATQFGTGSTLADASTGLARFTLPADAIDSVAVLPNPYAVEFGRFSSGLVVIRTRRAGDLWRTRLGNLDPSLRIKRHEQYKVTGISSFGPRFETGGPLIKRRLFLEQTAQYRYDVHDVSSRPEDELQKTQWFSAFTRLDANLTPRHSAVGTVALFPSATTFATLGTFTPPQAAVDLYNRVGHAGLTERAIWTDTLISETTAQVHRYRTRVDGQGTAPMEVLPETTLGNFFNRQHRTTTTYQLIQTMSGSRNGSRGLHLFKAGIDLLHSRYDGSSASDPVLLRRSDGTLVRRLDFDGRTTQLVRTTDIALFVQDRAQPGARWYMEFGGRVDRDGVTGRVNGTPRLGAAVLLNPAGTSVLRGGYGLFYERTPSAAGAFDVFESATETRYERDGLTPLGAPVRFVHRSAQLRTARSAAVDFALDHRITTAWLLHLGLLDRRGDNELMVEPHRDGEGGELLLDSSGRSTYREAEVSARYNRKSVDVHMSYVRSTARGDLNALTSYFDAVLRPVVGANGYGPANADVPHRFFARGRFMPSRWLLTGMVDWRTGFPYSVVDEAFDFVGPRNVGYRFPNTFSVDLGLEHKFTGLKWKPWIGIRVYNVLNSFQPRDVQANLSSPAFGSFYNSDLRQFRVQLRFAR